MAEQYDVVGAVNRQIEGMRIMQAAHVAHEACRAVQRTFGHNVSPKFAEQEDHAAVKGQLEAVQYVMRHPSVTPEQMHDRWAKARRVDGWTYGSAYDLEHKRHPCLVTWRELPADQRVKDELFVAIARLLLGKGEAA